jgi:ribosomal-protein-alanine N-acetyltransferase
VTVEVRLRPFTEDDLGFLDRLDTDPDAFGPFQWFGFRDPHTRRKAWLENGLISDEKTVLGVELPTRDLAGVLSWRSVQRASRAGACIEIGVAPLPAHRGHGVGTAAHRELVAYLWRYTTVHRLEAWSEAENLAEQKVLERVGFQRGPAPGDGLAGRGLAGRGRLRTAAELSG